MKPRHSRETLEKGAEQIFHNVTMLFSYYAWIAKVDPCIDREKLVKNPADQVYHAMVTNALLDGYLINIRRLNEFFSAPNTNEHSDDLRAYHYGFTSSGRFLDPDINTQLHKQIAHSSIEMISRAQVPREAYNLTAQALKPSLDFLEFIAEKFHGSETSKGQQMMRVAQMLLGYWEDWCVAVEENDARIAARKANENTRA